MLLPLSPGVLAMLHDPDVYTVAHRQGVVRINRDGDAEALNAHQILNCAANVFFQDWARRDQIADAVRATVRVRPERRPRTTYAVQDRVVGQHTRHAVAPLEEIDPAAGHEVLIHTEILRPRPEQWPGFLAVRRDARALDNGARTGFVRRACFEEGFVTGEGFRQVRL